MSKHVPFIDLTRYESGFLETVQRQTAELLAKAQFVGGSVVSELEKELSSYVGTQFSVACANGTDAIQLALRALDVGPGDTVLIPDLTFWATFEAVVNVGARPVCVDVEFETLHLSVELLKQAIQHEKPKACILVHLYGWAAPHTLEIRNLCRELGVLLIEDSAQALGVEFFGQPLFKGALVSTTSFYPAKVLGASGDAGAVFCNDQALSLKLRSLVNHGRSDHYLHGLVGWNSRMGTYEANYLLRALPHLNARLKSRREVTQRYQKLSSSGPLQVLAPPKEVLENGYLSVALVQNGKRDAVQAKLKERGIATGVVYPGPMSEQPAAKKFGVKVYSKGCAQKICSSIINLPCFPYMTEEELTYISEQLSSLE